MAAATKSLDTDVLSLRTVFEKNIVNQNVSSTKVLASDGQNGTFWAASQLLGGLPTFNAFETSASKFYATETNRTLRLSASDGFSMRASTIYGTSLSYIDVSGSSSIHNSKVKIATSGFLSALTDIKTNSLTFYSSKPAPALSTGDLYFQQLKIISSLQSPIDTKMFKGNSIFSGKSYDFYTTFAAVSPLALSSFTTTKEVFLSMYPYTAAGFFKISTTVGGLFISSLSTISSVYITKPDFSTGMGSVSSLEFLNHSTNVSTLVELSNYSQIRYLNAVGNTLARAFVVQLTDQFGTLNGGLSTMSTFQTPKSLFFSMNANILLKAGSQVTSTISTFTDFGNGTSYKATIGQLRLFSTQLSTLSTSLGYKITSMSNTAKLDQVSYILSTSSTISQLGSLGYLSSSSLVNTVISLPYVTANTYVATVNSSPIISTLSLNSTFTLKNNSGVYTDKSTFIQTLQSTVKQVTENASYVSSSTLDFSLQSTVIGLPFIIGNYIQNDTLISTTQGIRDYASLNGYVSSFPSLDTSQYISSKTLDYALYSTTKAIFSETQTISTASLTSTVNGLGQIYLSAIKVSSFGLITAAAVAYSGNKSLTTTSYFAPTYSSNSNSTGVFVYQYSNYIFPNINPYYNYNSNSATYFMNTDIFLQTATLDMNPFTSYIKNTSRVQIDFNLNIYINRIYNNTNSNFPERLLPMTSYLTYGATQSTISEASFTEHVYYNTVIENGPAIKITKKISFNILGQYLQSLPTNIFTLRHRIQNFTFSSDGNGGLDGQYLVFPSPQNSIFVSIYN